MPFLRRRRSTVLLTLFLVGLVILMVCSVFVEYVTSPTIGRTEPQKFVISSSDYAFYNPLQAASPYRSTRNLFVEGSNVSHRLPNISAGKPDVKNTLYKYPHTYRYIINPNSLCKTTSDRVEYLFLVFSAVENFNRRKAIRRTWGTLLKRTGPYRLGFLLARPSNQILQSAVESESVLNSDIIQEDFADTYRNATLKAIMMLKWTRLHCEKLDYLVKVDDDTFVNIPNLLWTIQSQPRKKHAIFGLLYLSSAPIRSLRNKWHVTEDEYPENYYPDYVSGSAYVITGDIVEPLYRTTLNTRPFPIEDAYITGVCAEKLSVPRVNIEGFQSIARPVSGCEYRNAITGHYVSAKDMYIIWEELKKTTMVCKQILFKWYFCSCELAGSDDVP